MKMKKSGEPVPPSLLNQVFDASYQKISDLVNGQKRYCLLLSVLESGIPDILYHHGPMEPEILLARLGYESELARLWIDALVEIGIIEKTSGQVQICQGLSPYLVSESPLYQGDSISSAKMSPWCIGTGYLKNEPDTSRRTEGKMTPEFLRIVAQHSLKGELQEITRILLSMKEFRSASTLLDIGGGHGMYSISFCQQNPNLSVVILDLPHIVQSTREIVERYGMEDRVEVISGDMHTDLPGSGYDLIYVSHILYRKDDLSVLLHRIIQVLNKGGLLISNHKFHDDWINSDLDAVTTLDHEMIKSHHRMIPEPEFLNILKSEGLTLIESRKVPATTGFSTLHIALKPN